MKGQGSNFYLASTQFQILYLGITSSQLRLWRIWLKAFIGNNSVIMYLVPLVSSISNKTIINGKVYSYHWKNKLGVKIIAPFFKGLYIKDDSIFCIFLFWIWKYSHLALNWHKNKFILIFTVKDTPIFRLPHFNLALTSHKT